MHNESTCATHQALFRERLWNDYHPLPMPAFIVRDFFMSAPKPFQPSPRTWLSKFQDAFAGVYHGIAGQSSFLVHGLAFLVVLVLGVVLQIAAWEWVAVLLVSGLVVTLELVNSALENLARAITVNHDSHIDRALKIASAAVLVAAGVAIIIGLIIFGPPLWKLVS